MLAEATPLALSRLLNLYPVSSLKDKWPQHRKKDEILAWVVENADRKEIREFLNEYLSCCKQHVHLFSHKNDVRNLPRFRIPEAEKVAEPKVGVAQSLFYVAEVEFHVVFTNPLGEDRIKFLWPMRLEFSREHLVVRFVMMEKNVRTYFPNALSSRTVGRSLSETAILGHLKEVLTELVPLDINKGIKHLWNADRIDSIKMKYRKSKSMATESMDAGAGIKKTYPEQYKELIKRPLHDGTFKVAENAETSIDGFLSNPTFGYLGFSSYSEHQGDTEAFVSEIIANN